MCHRFKYPKKCWSGETSLPLEARLPSLLDQVDRSFVFLREIPQSKELVLEWHYLSGWAFPDFQSECFKHWFCLFFVLTPVTMKKICLLHLCNSLSSSCTLIFDCLLASSRLNKPSSQPLLVGFMLTNWVALHLVTFLSFSMCRLNWRPTPETVLHVQPPQC